MVLRGSIWLGGDKGYNGSFGKWMGNELMEVIMKVFLRCFVGSRVSMFGYLFILYWIILSCFVYRWYLERENGEIRKGECKFLELLDIVDLGIVVFMIYFRNSRYIVSNK